MNRRELLTGAALAVFTAAEARAQFDNCLAGFCPGQAALAAL